MSICHILIDCPDEKGLVHKITGVLYQHDLNIISNNEFVDHTSGRFFMRTAFSGQTDLEKIQAEILAVLPDSAKVRCVQAQKKQIVVFASREYHCLGDLLIRHAYNDLNADVLAVISDYADLGALVGPFDIPFHHVPRKEKTQQEHESEIAKILKETNPKYLVLAKYMRVLSGEFVTQYVNRIINIHHSFLPAFAGLAPYQQASDRGVKIIGATAHFVTEKLDEGPIIAQSVTPTNHTQQADEMARAGRDIEKIVLNQALKLVFEDRVFVHQNKTVIF